MGLFNKLKAAATDAKLTRQQQSGTAISAQASTSTSPGAAPASSSTGPFVVAHDGQLFCQGRPYRFVGLNAPELLDGDVNGPFEYWHTFATLAADRAFGRAVTRTYTLRVSLARSILSARVTALSSSELGQALN
jgi:hypothetical protein